MEQEVVMEQGGGNRTRGGDRTGGRGWYKGVGDETKGGDTNKGAVLELRVGMDQEAGME